MMWFLQVIASLSVALFILAPWFLGYTLVRACLKQRYGYQWFAIGVGYAIGLAIVSCLMRYAHLLPAMKEIWFVGLLGLAIVVHILFRPEQCFVGEQRAEMLTPIWQKMLMLLLGCVLLLLFLLIIILQKNSYIIGENAVLLRMNAYFSAQLKENDAFFYACWWMLYPALGCAVFGTLRYAQCTRFVAFLGMFGVLTVPMLLRGMMLDAEMVWRSILVLAVLASLAHERVYREWRQIVLFFVTACALWFTAPTNWTMVSDTIWHTMLFSSDWSLLFYAFGLSGLILTFSSAPSHTSTHRLAQTYFMMGIAVIAFAVFYARFRGVASSKYLFYFMPVLALLPPLTLEACRKKMHFG